MITLQKIPASLFFMIYFAWAITYEISNYLSKTYEGVFLISADKLPNQIFNLIEMHYWIAPILLFLALIDNREKLQSIKATSCKNISPDDSAMCARFILSALMTVIILGIALYPKTLNSGHIAAALITGLTICVLAYYRILDKGVACILLAKVQGKTKNTPNPAFTEILQTTIKLVFMIAIFFLTFLASMFAGMTTKATISIIGSNSLNFSPPLCISATLKPTYCENSKNIAIKNGNLFMLSSAYSVYPPANSSELYHDIDATLKFANSIYMNEQWADSIQEQNMYSFMKKLHLEKHDEHQMTLIMLKKAIQSGREIEFIQEMSKNKRGGLLLPVLETFLKAKSTK